MNNLLRVVLAPLVAAAAAFFPVGALAQSTDYAVTLEGIVSTSNPAVRVAVGQPVHYVLGWEAAGVVDPERVMIELDVPGVAPRLHGGFGLSCAAGDPIRCTLDLSAAPSGVAFIEARADAPGMHTATARVIHLDGQPDPNPANDEARHTFEAIALPSLQVTSIIPLQRVEPGVTRTISVYVQNHASIPATNVVLTVSLPAGGAIIAAETTLGSATCGITNSVLVCTTPTLVQAQNLGVDVTITAPARLDGADLVVQMSVTSAEQDFDPADNQGTRTASMVRQFLVTNVDDEGSGSLRQAMHDANALCAVPQACAILFRIPAPAPASGWFTIQPRTPLPAVTGTLKIDGKTQTLFTGDTNPDGPEIEINGAFAGSAAGLRLRPNCDMEISNLAVNGFPGFGIEIRKPVVPAICNSEAQFRGAIVRENYLGTDPRGRTAKPNHRGLGIFSHEAFVYDNVIGGNRRAGIYAQDGFYCDIDGNRIGVGTDGSPLGNGAGIFIDAGFGEYYPAGGDIAQNVIAYNDGMAIARTRRGEIFISKNSIFDNLQQGIDVDIDGPTAQRADDTDVPNAPVLFSATYDGSQDATIVRGRIDSEMYANTRNVEVYASSRLSVWATPQAEQWVATAQLLSGHEGFEIVVPGDLRGKWMTATYNGLRYVSFIRNPRRIGTQTHRALHPTDTSELSNAVMAR